MARTKPFAAIGLAAILIAAPALADNVVPAGPEFMVSRGHASYYAYMDGYAMAPSVTREPNGEFVVAWEEIAGRYSNVGTSYQYRVAARRFNRDGTGTGQQFTIYQQPKDGPHVGGYPRVFHPDVAADPD